VNLDLDLDLRTVDLDLHLDLTVAGLVTSLVNLHFFAFKIERVVKYHRVMPTPSPMRKKKGCNDHGS